MYRITVRGTGIKLCGWIDGDERVREFAAALVTMNPDDPMIDPMLVASPDPTPTPRTVVPPTPKEATP
jgi:hypothetical protein